MNEVTKIHLGRQAFTISVDAYHELRIYLDAIQKQVDEEEVVNEIELRMAELLAEHGINATKVILLADVDFLKEQLGNPADFKEDEDETRHSENKTGSSKRLFRDTDNAILAGVAAGFANYLGIDALLVRLIFIILVFVTVGWGVLVYILLWLLVPEARTSSERLKMAGKPVTVNSLKEIVENADVKGAAHRANITLAGPINKLFGIVLRLVGLVFVLLGLIGLFALTAGEVYLLTNNTAWQKNNIFPISFREHLLLDIAVTVLALVAVLIITTGVAIFRRSWPIKTWITGVLVGLIFIGLAAGSALTAVAYPGVRDRYIASVHTSVRSVSPFTTVNASGMNVGINYQPANNYSVTLNYYGHPNLATIKTDVKNGQLLIDTSRFNAQRDCNTLCIPSTYNMVITVYAPNAYQLETQLRSNFPPVPPLPSIVKQQS
jgi:phage shock protein PspC (stress-responsive transcriptional regulator)